MKVLKYRRTIVFGVIALIIGISVGNSKIFGDDYVELEPVELAYPMEKTKDTLFLNLKGHETTTPGKQQNNNGSVAGQKIAYLTFDDGPTPHTPEILNILKEKKVNATFFLVGTNIKKNPEITKRIVDEGNYPGLHSMTHKKEILYQGNPENVANEMLEEKKLLKLTTGFDSVLTRVPYGSKPYMKEGNRDNLAKFGFKMWDWNIDSYDWKYENANSILTEIEKQAKGKNSLVILMHDKKQTAKILPEVIDYLVKEGYQLKVYNPNEHVQMNFWKDARF